MSISRKLTLIIGLACIVPLLMICGFLTAFEFEGERDALAKQLSMLASVTAWNASGAVALGDTKSAETMLAGLKADPAIRSACLHDRQGRLLAAYRPAGSAFACPGHPSGPGQVLERGTLAVTRPILQEGESIGTVLIRSDLRKVESRVYEYVELVPWLLAACVGLTLLLSSRLQRAISAPIRNLANVASMVAARKDYSLRAPHAGADEVGRLVEAFNGMLEQMARHSGELSAINRELEASKLAAEKSAEALAESEGRFRSTFDEGPLGMAIIDAGGIMLEGNRSLQAMLGYSHEELCGTWMWALTHPEDRAMSLARFQEITAGGRSRYQIVKRYLTKGGRALWVRVTVAKFLDEHGTPMSIGMVEDMSEQKNLEEQCRQSQKMEAIGRLAGGVAHDFNNLLTVIKGNTELLIKRLGVESPMHRNLGQVRKAADRAATLVDQLLTFSRKQFIAPQVLDLNPAVRDMVRMLPPLIGEDIEFALQLGAESSYVKIDPVQLEQVVFNLAINARDAMPSGGHLTLRTRVRRPGTDAVPGGEAWCGSIAELSLVDTGTGMTEEVRARIFEPFFTTKDVGKGTGLGLATVYGLVQHAGGTIEVETEPGFGSTFTVCLPMVDPASACSPVEPEQGTAVDGRGKETVLVVEDEELVRTIVCETLTEHGYRVIEGRNPEHALALLRANREPVHLLLTDIVMPRMNGCELAQQVRLLLPGTKVLYISGYSDRIPSLDGDFLQKPFTPDELIGKVRAVLDYRYGATADLARLGERIVTASPAASPAAAPPIPWLPEKP
jgi:PAS domain S-box-containing protein